MLDKFTTAYLAAALWSSTDETNPEQGGEPLDKNYGIDDIESETLAEMVRDCKRFQEENASLITNENLSCTATTCETLAGHDFWLTRNGHGAGFWDGDWVEPAATTLSDNAASYAEYNISATGKGGQVKKPIYYDCGICDHFHPWGWDGDCRDDENRLTYDDLDDRHGENGYEIRSMKERLAADALTKFEGICFRGGYNTP